jgi:hypothetical protein
MVYIHEQLSPAHFNYVFKIVTWNGTLASRECYIHWFMDTVITE